MKKIFFVLVGLGMVFGFVLYMNQSLAAYTQGDSNLFIEYDIASVEGRTYRAECLVRCDLPIRIKYDGTLATEEYTFNHSDFNKSFIFMQGNVNDFTTLGIEYLTTENYTVVIDEWGMCVEETFFNQTTGKNETIQRSCIVGNHTEQRTRKVWKEFNGSLTVKKGEYFYINLYSEKKASLSGFSVDIIPSLKISNLKINLTEFAWWNSSWTRKKEINISDTSGSTISSYSVRLNITYDSDMQADFDDLRFLDDSETVERDYWIEQKSNSNWAIVWVQSGITANANRTIFMYYGNAGASTSTSINNTFLLAEDFQNGGYDVAQWQNQTSGTGKITFQTGYINQTFTDASSQKADVYSISTFGLNKSIISYAQITGTGGASQGFYGTGFSTCISGEVGRPCLTDPSGSSTIWQRSAGSMNEYHSNYKNFVGTDITVDVQQGAFRYYELARIDNQSMYRIDHGSFGANAADYNKSNQYALIGAENGKGWMLTDLTFVRDFVFPEPTYVIGTEQNFSNSCTCPSINTNWNVDLSNYCIITSACEIGLGNITFTGVGNFTCNANINASNLDDPGNNNYIYIKSSCRMNLG